MSDYTPWEPTTADIRERYSDWYDGPNKPPVEIAQAEFDRWLKQVKAQAWEEGFDAGEKDVWEHERKQDWGSVDTKCIPNPYFEGENK